MSVFQDIRSISPDLSTPDLLRFLIKEKFAGKTLVTASLKAPSVATLKLVADIDPATPVAFCIRGFQFPESGEYRKRIVELLGLENVSHTEGGEVEIQPGDHDHCDQTLAPYSCWISAVYHMPREPQVTHRVDVEGRLIRIDPLIRWTKDDVRAFMHEHKLPFHPRVARRKPERPLESESSLPSYNY
jgi:phosphoadenosine phosphosulfate reductase